MTRPLTVLVTGGNRGIGLEVCRRLGTLGYRVLLAGRNRDQAEAAASSLGEEGGQVLARVLDVTDPGSIRDLAEAVEQEFGGAYVLVNNAAVLLAQARTTLRARGERVLGRRAARDHERLRAALLGLEDGAQRADAAPGAGRPDAQRAGRRAIAW